MMDSTKRIFTLYAGGAAAVGAAFAAATLLGVTVPVALGIGYAISGASIFAAASMDD